MKKILATTLALLMIMATVSLAACSKDKDKEDDTEDDEFENNYQTSASTDADTDADTEGETDEQTEDDNNDENNYGEWISKNDTVCVGMDNVNLREGPGNDYAAPKKLDAGVSLKRTSTNGVWDKVTYKNVEYYVRSALVTSDVDDFNFNAYAEEEQIKLNVIGDYQINLRTSPFYSSNYADQNIGISGFTASYTDEATEELKLLAVSESGDWYKVSYTGEVGSTVYEDKVFYIAASSSGYVDGLASNSNTDNGEGIG